MDSLDPTTILLLIIAGFFAGWVDAIVGGGGLIQLPAVLMLPGITPVQALATNKMGSIFGTTASALTYYRRTTIDLTTALPTAGLALLASLTGAATATLIPSNLFKPIILLALIAVLIFTIFKPELGQSSRPQHPRTTHYTRALTIGATIGFYDGIMGPGTGSFLVLALTTLLGLNFLQATGQAKIINLATNLGAIIYFSTTGHLIWQLGLILGLANLCGGYLGARTAITRGTRFIRHTMILVVTALILKLSWDLITGLQG